MTRFGKLLEDECVPIRANIETDRTTVLDDLSGRVTVKEKFESKVRSEFQALLDRLSKANNIYEAIAMQTESDRMKQRLIQSFADEEQRMAQAEAVKVKAEQGADTPTAPPVRVRKTKTVTMKNLFAGTSQISSEADIDRLVDDVRNHRVFLCVLRHVLL